MSIEPFDDATLERSFQRASRAAGLNIATLAAGFGFVVALLLELFDRISPRVSSAGGLTSLLTPELRLLAFPLLGLCVYLGLRHRQWLLGRYVAGMSLLVGVLLLVFAVPFPWSEPLVLVPLRPVIGLNLLIFFTFAFLRLPVPIAVVLGCAALAGHLWSATTWYQWATEPLTLIGYPALAAVAGWLLSRPIQTRERRLYLASMLAQGAEHDRMQRIDEFVHDLRGPLAALDAEMHHVARQAPTLQPDDVDRRMHSMVEELAWVRDHLEDFSRWSKGDDPLLPLRLSTLPLSHLIEWIRSQFEALCREQGVALQIAVAKGIVDRELSTNRSAIYSIVMNLVSNAIKYRDPAKRADAWVKVEFSEQDHFCVIRVLDNGIGISVDELPRIWQPGFRSSQAIGLSEGSGLGLSITRERVERLAHHSLTSRSTLGQGSQFTLRVPWDRPEVVPTTTLGYAEPAGTTIRRANLEESDDGAPNTLSASTIMRVPVSRVLLLAQTSGTFERVSALMDPYSAFIDEASTTRALQALLREGDSTYDYMVISVTHAMNLKKLVETVRRDHGFDVPAIIMLPFWRFLKVRRHVERQIPEVRCLWIGRCGDRFLRNQMRETLSRSLDLQARVIGSDS